MTQQDRIFCWHHSGRGRLERLLSQGLIDCPKEEFLDHPPKGARAIRPGDILRVSLKEPKKGKGRVVAIVRLTSARPFRLKQPLHQQYPYAVKVEVLRSAKDLGLDCLGICDTYPFPHPPPMNPSHWADAGK